VQFWSSGVTPSPEDRVVDRLAVDQVLASLKHTYRDAITALALADDYAKGAELLGLNYTAFTARLSIARRQILTLWHEGETPHRVRRTDRRVESHTGELATHCGNGHEWTPENTRWAQTMQRGKPKRRRFCRRCEHERAIRRRITQSEGA
jgi:hypothetical protein